MAFEERIEQYQKASWIKRGIILMGLGVVYPLYFYSEEVMRIEGEIEQVESQLNLAKKKHTRALKKKRDLPALKQKIVEASRKLAEIKVILPSDFNIDEVLREVASVAKELDVVIRRFDPSMNSGVSLLPGDVVVTPDGPQPEAKPNKPQKVTEKKYEEHPVKLEVEGTFIAVTKFYDSLLHLGYLVHLRDVEYKTLENDNDKSLKVVKSGDSGITISSNAKMIVFKSIGLGDL